MALTRAHAYTHTPTQTHTHSEDKKLSKIIDQKKRKIERMQANLGYWKKKIVTNQKECEERNQFMREQKEAISKHCQGEMLLFNDPNIRITLITLTIVNMMHSSLY